jgi:hypothetical protein
MKRLAFALLASCCLSACEMPFDTVSPFAADTISGPTVSLTVRGIVSDTAGKPIPFPNVYLVHVHWVYFFFAFPETDLVLAKSVGYADGRYVLTYTGACNSNVMVSYMGTVEQGSVRCTEQPQTVNITYRPTF